MQDILSTCSCYGIDSQVNYYLKFLNENNLIQFFEISASSIRDEDDEDSGFCEKSTTIKND